jgi:hypothetical protein
MQRPPLTIHHDEREVFPERSRLDCRDQRTQTWAYGISGLTNLPIFDSPTSAAGDAEWNCRPLVAQNVFWFVMFAVPFLCSISQNFTQNRPQNFNFETPYYLAQLHMAISDTGKPWQHHP